MKIAYVITFCLLSIILRAQYQPVNFSNVTITDAFWAPKIRKVADSTIPACIYQTESKTARIRNFEKVARKSGEKHEGIYYDDSDVYKALEAIAYSLRNKPDPALEQKADSWISKIAAAQLPDGYLNTYYTLTDLSKRWTDMEKHEDYCAGHLIEAGIAYYNTTKKRTLLDVAIKFADHIDSTFRLNNRAWVSGHQEIELALMKLYHLTDNNRYKLLADWFLDQRGRGHGKGVIWDEWKAPQYCQDDVPVKQQKEITGHAVRAMYMYTGAADVAAVTGDKGYINAMKAVWDDVVQRNMYITGGIGSSGSNEGFTTDYDLPNENAYCETCASVGMVFWNQRMNQLTGESKYIDVLERCLYNGALDGLSLSGNRFFYGNPLASKGQHNRKEWFGTACCPSNIARLVSSVGNYIYGESKDAIWVNLFIGNTANLKTGTIRMETNYPWEGKVKLFMNDTRQALHIRIPGPLYGGLYYPIDTAPSHVKISVNNKPVNYSMKNGYAVINRKWKKGDVVEIDLPMEVKLIASRPEVKANNGRLAIQRGPLIYCVEGVDNNGDALNMSLSENTKFAAQAKTIATESVIVLQSQTQHKFIAIPYYVWANRGPSSMQVWLPIATKN